MSEVKERPDSPGVWWEKGSFTPFLYSLPGKLTCIDGAEWCNLDDLKPSLWIKHDLQPPEFPQLPERPKLVYASNGDHDTWWFLYHKDGEWRTIAGCNTCDSRSMQVIHHPGNDPEAVAAIEEAQR